MTEAMQQAIDEFASKFAQSRGFDAFGATQMTCSEAETLADVLRAGGYSDAAEGFLDEHAGADEVGDDHYGRLES